MDGRAGSEGVAEQVQQGRAVVGFMVSAVPAHLIMRVADADLILPAKVRIITLLVAIYVYACYCTAELHSVLDACVFVWFLTISCASMHSRLCIH